MERTKTYRLITGLGRRGLLNWVPDALYAKWLYRQVMGKKLNLKEPKTFNEKLQWLKLHDRKPLYTELVDKYGVRKHIAAAIGGEHLIPLVGGPWESFDQIDFDQLPEQFVLKCTHDSGGVVICRDKSKLDMAATKAKIEDHLKRNYYLFGREWPYKDVPPRIIAEAYMEDETSAHGLTDYKFFCFHGEPKMIYVSQGMDHHATANMSFFDMSGKVMPFRRSDYAPRTEPLILPENYDEMVRAAGVLAKMTDSPFARIDLYSIRGKLYFSEVTFTPCNGMMPLEPAQWDETLGGWIELPAFQNGKES